MDCDARGESIQKQIRTEKWGKTINLKREKGKGTDLNKNYCLGKKEVGKGRGKMNEG